jgi:hypothetical protein
MRRRDAGRNYRIENAHGLTIGGQFQTETQAGACVSILCPKDLLTTATSPGGRSLRRSISYRLDNTDLTNLMAGVLATAIPGAAWYTSATGYAQAICRLAAVSGGLTAVLQSDGTIKANFLGFPVKFSGKLPDVSTDLSTKPMLFFGNLAMSSVIVERQQQTIIAISHDRAMDQDQVLVRGVQRCDIINHTVGDASTRGPVAMLVGTA